MELEDIANALFAHGLQDFDFTRGPDDFPKFVEFLKTAVQLYPPIEIPWADIES